MDATHLLALVASAAGGAVCAALGLHWRHAKQLSAAHERLTLSEHARHAAVERSMQARAQITQLSQALVEAKQSLQAQRARERAAAEQQAQERAAAARAEAPTLVLPRREPPAVFADTQLLQTSR